MTLREYRLYMYSLSLIVFLTLSVRENVSMSYITINPNPKHKLVGDCVIRALAVATGQDWDTVFLALCVRGFKVKDMPNANEVWGSYLRENGFTREAIPNTCPDCYTVKDFIKDHPKGTFVLGTGTHAVTVIDGTFYDTGDCGDETVLYFYEKGEA